MGLAMRGITHCEKCGNPLKFGEYYKCERCLMQEIDKQEKLKARVMAETLRRMANKIENGFPLTENQKDLLVKLSRGISNPS